MSVRGPCAGRGGGAGASVKVQSGAVRNVSVIVRWRGCQSRASLFVFLYALHILCCVYLDLNTFVTLLLYSHSAYRASV